MTAYGFDREKCEYLPDARLDPNLGREENDALVERIGNAMMLDGQFDRAHADEFAATSRFIRVPAHLHGWWKALLEGIAARALAGTLFSHELEWRYLSSPTALVGKKVRPISEDEFYSRFGQGLPVGAMEWAHVSAKASGSEVILFLLSGPRAEEEIRVFSSTVSATSDIHRAAMRDRIVQHPVTPQPLEPFEILPLHAPIRVPTRMRAIDHQPNRPMTIRVDARNNANCRQSGMDLA